MRDSGMAGGIAAAMTTPLDCVKTVLNTQQTPEICTTERRILLKARYSGIADAIVSIYALRGVAGFFRGEIRPLLFKSRGRKSGCANWAREYGLPLLRVFI